MCDFCKEWFFSHYKIESANSTMNICTACVLEKILENNLTIPDGDYIGELSIDHQRNHENAVKVTFCYEHREIGKPYFVTPEQALRLLGHQLMPNEVIELIENGHDPEEFDIHDDFYNDIGLAVTPLLKDSYVEGLKNYLELNPNSFNKEDLNRVEEYIDYLEKQLYTAMINHSLIEEDENLEI